MFEILTITSGVEIEEFGLEINNSVEGLIDILEVFYTADENEFRDNERFGRISQIGSRLTVNGNQVLREGRNYFWLSVKLFRSCTTIGQYQYQRGLYNC